MQAAAASPSALPTGYRDEADISAPVAEHELSLDVAESSHRLSLHSIAAAAVGIRREFLHSPQYECEPLSAQLGCALTLKVECVNPVRSFKGRGADWFLQQWLARGGRGPLVCASAGNFGQALAYVCRREGIALTVYAAQGANALKLERMRALGAELRLHGEDFDAAKQAARAHAEINAATFVEDGEEAAISEGAGSIAVELCAGAAVFDALLVPLGNGALLNGMARWSKHRAPATQVIGVVARGAPAMARSWRAGEVVVTDAARTIADGIAVRVPVPVAVADMHGLVDAVIEVDESDLVSAMRLVQQHAGLVLEPAGAAGVAALIAEPARFAGLRVATVLCGGNVTTEQMARWLG